MTTFLHRFRVAVMLATCGCTASSDPAPERGRTAVFSEPVVLLVSPDSLEVDRLRRELGDDFYVTADDAMWYRAEALALLDRLGIPHRDVGRGAARFLVDGEPRVVSWEATGRAWFSIVYDGRAEPKLASDIDLREAVSNFPRTRR